LEIPVTVEWVSFILAAVYIFIVLVFIRGWNRLQSYSPAGKALSTKVSVIIAARNEEDGIKKTLDDLIQQSYHKDLTEIICIDDHSTDRTAQIISSYKERGVNLIQLKEDKPINSYKKKAIQMAIAQCFGKLIVTTDADCRMGSNWLSTIVSFYEENDYKMISSPVGYHQEKNVFERAQSLEFLYLIGLGAATIGNKKAATCNGANLAYEKEAFYEVGGFKGIDDLASGDDELLLHKVAKRYANGIGFLKSREAVVYTHAKGTLKEFIQQRKRWSSKSTRYKNKSIILLGAFIWLYNFGLILTILMSLVDAKYIIFALTHFLLKMIVEFVFLYQVTGFVRRRRLLTLLPAVSIVHALYIIYIGIAGNTGKYNWKGRLVR
jgi:cellulose synthase/poly-beta-1,6-N-acetylglucosamine synthase-like glycosyltransferase